MRKWTKTAGLLFWAAASVYSNQVSHANTGESAKSPTQPDATGSINVLEQPTDPFTEVLPQPAEAAPSAGTSVKASEVAIDESGIVEIHVNDANLVEVLRMLSLQSQKNIIASKGVGGKVTANLYGVTVREALDAILHANGYAYREKGNFIYVYTAKEVQEMEAATRVMNTEIFRLYYTPAANAANMIKPVLSNGSQVAFTTAAAAGLKSGTANVGGNDHATEDIIVVTDYPDVLDRVRRIIREVDRRPQQILIEATILRASLSEDNALGVDFTVLGGVDFSAITHQNGNITGANMGETVPDGTLTSVGTGRSFAGNVPGGLKVGFVSNNVAMFLSALEAVTDTTVLANPKILALNKQQGEVIVGRKDGYLTTTVTDSATIQTVEFLDTGTRLIFRPYIGDDGYIRMEIHPEDSSGGLTGANLPFKITTEVTTNVMVKDGHTLVIGGLFRDSSETARSQIPFLGNLPLAGTLFRNQRDRTVREEVIILLTPHIVKDDAAYARASEQELREMEKLRVGVRRGMMPWGRERMADASYQKAVAELNKPEPDRKKALWYLNCATNLNPKFSEAITLKEELTGRELVTADNSTIRTFVRRQILAEQFNPPTTQPEPEREDVRITPSPAPTAAAPSEQPVAEAPAETKTAQAPEVLDAPATEQVATKQGFWSWLFAFNHHMFSGHNRPGNENPDADIVITETSMDSAVE